MKVCVRLQRPSNVELRIDRSHSLPGINITNGSRLDPERGLVSPQSASRSA